MVRIFLLLFFALGLRSQAQVVNIEARRIEADTTGWYGSLSGNFDLNKNDKLTLNAAANVQIERIQGKHLFLTLANVKLIKADGQDFVNAAFQHLRYNYQFHPKFTGEAFTQIQYNQILKVQLRWLMGAGARFTLAKTSKLKMYAGLAQMYEYEEVANPLIFHRDFRASSYFTLNWFPNEQFSLSSTTYYQPLIQHFSDFRFSGQLRMTVKINQKLDLRFGVDGLYDSNPPDTVPTTVYSLNQGLGYKF